MRDELQFLRGAVANPLSVGAIAPSSSSLGRAIAAQIDLDLPGPVAELGPGTGAVTREILRRGVGPERLTVIEYDPVFARKITERLRVAR